MLSPIGGNSNHLHPTGNQAIVELMDQATAQAAADTQSMLTGAAIVTISAQAFAQQAAAAVAP
jgi:hypothetical protein